MNRRQGGETNIENDLGCSFAGSFLGLFRFDAAQSDRELPDRARVERSSGAVFVEFRLPSTRLRR